MGSSSISWDPGFQVRLELHYVVSLGMMQYSINMCPPASRKEPYFLEVIFPGSYGSRSSWSPVVKSLLLSINPLTYWEGICFSDHTDEKHCEYLTCEYLSFRGVPCPWSRHLTLPCEAERQELAQAVSTGTGQVKEYSLERPRWVAERLNSVAICCGFCLFIRNLLLKTK